MKAGELASWVVRGVGSEQRASQSVCEQSGERAGGEPAGDAQARRRLGAGEHVRGRAGTAGPAALLDRRAGTSGGADSHARGEGEEEEGSVCGGTQVRFLRNVLPQDGGGTILAAAQGAGDGDGDADEEGAEKECGEEDRRDYVAGFVEETRVTSTS